MCFGMQVNLNFSFSKQKNKKAPLIFILAGTGSDYNATRVKFMQRIFHDVRLSYNSNKFSNEPTIYDFCLNKCYSWYAYQG